MHPAKTRRLDARLVAAFAIAAVLCLRAMAPGQQGTGQEEPGYINMSFDQVDVRAFVKLVGEATGMQFVMADDVKGNITVTAPRVRRSEVYPLFVSILESVGCSVVEDEGMHRIVRLGVRPVPAAPVIGAGEETPARGIVTKVLRLEHVSAGEMSKLLESKVGGGKMGALGAIEDTGHLVITDTAENVRRIEKIVAEIDQPGMARMTEIVALQFAGAEDLARQLNLALQESDSRGERLRRRLPAVQALSEKRRAVVVAAPHANSLILVGTSSQLGELKKIIENMDVDVPSSRGRLNAIFLEHISSEEAAKSINSLLEKSVGKEAGPQARKIAIEASVANNALLVDASPGDFDVVKKLVEQLDRLAEQVLIEVLIAEISADNSLELGVEMSAVNLSPVPGSPGIVAGTRLTEQTESIMNSIQGGIFPRGITVGVAQGMTLAADGSAVAGIPALINFDALKRTGRFKILSETALEAQNNREASVSIVNEIPILKSTIEGGGGTTRDVVQNIERIDVGIKLKLTPHVIKGEHVRMVLNPSIEAVIDPGPPGTQFAPTIAKREVSTTVTVPEGRTIIIAGLTREDTKKIVRKVPILGSIPLLGMLFRQTTDAVEKTNMLIFVTPHVVTRIAEAEKVIESWEQKTGLSPDEQQ